MRILIIASLFRPYTRGGAEIVAQTIADELKKTHEVTIVTTRTWDGFRSFIPHKNREDGLSVYRFYPCNFFSFASIEDGKPFYIRLLWHAFAILNVHSYVALRFVIAKEQPDCIYTHNLTGIGFLVPAAIRHSRAAWVHTVHDVQLAIPSGVLMAKKELSSRGFVDRSYSALLRACMGSPAGVIYPSEFLRTFYDRRGFFPKSKKYFLSNPIPDTVRFTREEYQDALHARLISHVNGETVFTYVGLLKAHKGLPDLLLAFSRLKDTGARLIIAGIGPLYDSLAHMAQRDNRISLMGHVSREEMRELYRRSHIAVVPSLLCENAPMVIQESFAAGIPIIAARSGGAAERIHEAENGFPYPPGDVDLLAHALDRAARLTNKQYETMSMRAYQTIQDDTVDLYCKKLIAFS